MGHGSTAVTPRSDTDSKVAPCGHLQGVWVDVACGCPSCTSVWERQHELLWDLLQGWDARLHPLRLPM